MTLGLTFDLHTHRHAPADMFLPTGRTHTNSYKKLHEIKPIPPASKTPSARKASFVFVALPDLLKQLQEPFEYPGEEAELTD